MGFGLGLGLGLSFWSPVLSPNACASARPCRAVPTCAGAAFATDRRNAEIVARLAASTMSRMGPRLRCRSRTPTSRPLGAAMLRGARWLAAASLLACFACIAACGWLDQLVYVDEAGLLAGFSAPTFSAVNVSRLPRWPPADPLAQQQWLVDRLDERELLPEVHVLRHGDGCSCAAVSAVVHAGRGDGREAVLLSTAATWKKMNHPRAYSHCS